MGQIEPARAALATDRRSAVDGSGSGSGGDGEAEVGGYGHVFPPRQPTARLVVPVAVCWWRWGGDGRCGRRCRPVAVAVYVRAQLLLLVVLLLLLARHRGAGSPVARPVLLVVIVLVVVAVVAQEPFRRPLTRPRRGAGRP
jgi:hypothetical protein